ncbi:MAG: hypothetical protein WDM81_02340 [Rhizomicrobium sp.]
MRIGLVAPGRPNIRFRALLAIALGWGRAVPDDADPGRPAARRQCSPPSPPITACMRGP